FDRGDDDEGPDDERQRPERDARVGPLAGQREDGLERVERARADVAEHDAERPHGREGKGGGGSFARSDIRLSQQQAPADRAKVAAKLKTLSGWVNETAARQASRYLRGEVKSAEARGAPAGIVHRLRCLDDRGVCLQTSQVAALIDVRRDAAEDNQNGP